MEEEDARDRSFKMRKRLFKTSSRLPQAAWQRLLTYSEGFYRRVSSLRISRCWRRKILQLAKRDIGEEGYCWERTNVHEEESDRLCVFKACGTTMHHARACSWGAPQRAVGARAQGVVWPDAGPLDGV